MRSPALSNSSTPESSGYHLHLESHESTVSTNNELSTLSQIIMTPEEEDQSPDNVFKVELFGRKIDFVPPNGATEKMLENYQRAFTRISAEKRLQPFINPQTNFTYRGGVRVEFSIEKDGQKIKYCADPENILRVDQEDTSLSDNRQQFLAVLKEAGILEKLKNHTNAIETGGISFLLEAGFLKSVFDLHGWSQAVYEKCRSLLEERIKLKQNYNGVSRMLFDESQGVQIRERSNSSQASSFIYEHLGHKGFLKKRIQYLDNSLKGILEFYPESQRLKSAEYFHPNGQQSSIAEYNSEEEMIEYSRYRVDGTLEEKLKDLGMHEYYDSDGEEVLYIIAPREIEIEKDGEVYNTNENRIFMLDKNNNRFSTLKYAQEQNPELSEDQYLNYLIENLSLEGFFVFEEHFLKGEIQEEEIPISLQKKIRVYGKELAGVMSQEREIEAKYGIRIETEEWDLNKHPNITNNPFSIKELIEVMTQINRALAMYPASFIKNSGLTEICLFADWQQNNLSFKNSKNFIHAGGFSFYNTGTIGIGSDAVNTLHHELLHKADESDAEFFIDDNHIWGMSSHGENYSRIYGDSGQEAILSGDAYNPRPKGFQGAYGKYGGVDEDQATMAEAVMGNQKDILQLASTEPALRKKINMTHEFYYVRSNGRMDTKFWEDLASGISINESYWEQRESVGDFISNPQFELARKEFLFLRDFSKELHQKNWGESLVLLHRLIENNPSREQLYHEQCIKIISKIKKEFRGFGLIYFSEKYPNQPEYHDYLAQVNDFGSDESFLHAEKAISLESKNPFPYQIVSMHLKKSAEIKKQIEILELALKRISPENVSDEIYSDLAEAYLLQGNKDQAIRVYEQSLKSANFTNLNTVSTLAYLYYDHRGDLEAAKMLYLNPVRERSQNSEESPETSIEDVYSYNKKLTDCFSALLRHSLQELREETNAPELELNRNLLMQYPKLSFLHSQKMQALEKMIKHRKEVVVFDFKELSNTYAQSGNYEAARALLESALELFSTEDPAKLSSIIVKPLISVLVLQNKIPEALRLVYHWKTHPRFLRLHQETSVETIIQFYEALSTSYSEDPSYYESYCFDLKERGAKASLQKIVKLAQEKFPEKRDRFESYLP